MREEKGREGEVREEKGREEKGREGKGRKGKIREGEGKEGERREEGEGREGEGREEKGKEGKRTIVKCNLGLTRSGVHARTEHSNSHNCVLSFYHTLISNSNTLTPTFNTTHSLSLMLMLRHML